MNLRSAVVIGGVLMALCAAATPARAQKSVAEVLGRPATIEGQPKTYLEELMLWGYCLLRGPKFLRAKLDSYRWIARHRDRIRERRRFVESVRRRSDWGLLRGLRWGYPLDQFLSLGRERGESARDRIAT